MNAPYRSRVDASFSVCSGFLTKLIVIVIQSVFGIFLLPSDMAG